MTIEFIKTARLHDCMTTTRIVRYLWDSETSSE